MKSIPVKKYLVLLLLILLLGACAQQGHKARGKIRRGKPIPCPIKDC